jgi:hypothetical protein
VDWWKETIMSSLRKKLDKATFRFEDVDVCLNGELAGQREALLEKMQEVAEGPVEVRMGMAPQLPHQAVREEIDALEEEMRDQLVTLRFRTLSFEKWNNLLAKHPPRDGLPLDARKGYNVVAVTKEAAEHSGWLVENGTPESIAPEEWSELWANLSGGDFDRIWGVITRLNESNGWVGVDFLKKGSGKTPSSTETSS